MVLWKQRLAILFWILAISLKGLSSQSYTLDCAVDKSFFSVSFAFVS